MSPRSSRLLLVLAWALCAAYAAIHLDHRWFPHDEGTLAHAAERVAAGELPHVDFDEVYTGGQSFFHAAAFEAFGTRLFTLRLVLYLVFLPWVAALLYLGTRFLAPVPAALAAIAAVAWSIPNYAAAMPSWYNLFLATFGTAALLRWSETANRRWLWLAGVCAGVSIAFKIVGFYFVAAALLFFVYRAAGRARDTEAPRAGRAYTAFVAAGLAAFVLVVARVLRADDGATLLDFVLPLAALAGVVLAREWRAPPIAFVTGVRALLAPMLPFLAGALLPLAILIVPYVREGALPDLLNGVFVLPAKRREFATLAPPGWARPLALPALVVVIALPLLRGRARTLGAVAVAVSGALLLALAGRGGVFPAIFRSLAELMPLALIGCAVALWRTQRNEVGADRSDDHTFLLLAAAATWSLVRYPFAGAIYYLYVTPLVLLAVVATASRARPVRARAVAGVVAFYALFALLWLGPNSLLGIAGGRWLPEADAFRPPIERAGLRMTRAEASQFTLLVDAVREHARGDYIYAAPDAPEVYFLTGMRNPTRTFYDFFDEPAGRTERVLAAVRAADVNVVVLKTLIPFSSRPAPDLEAALRAEFPQVEEIGLYVVRWRR